MVVQGKDPARRDISIKECHLFHGKQGEVEKGMMRF